MQGNVPIILLYKPMIIGIMQKTLALIALIVLGCTALEVVDVIFTMRLYSGLLP
jgi:hypothetical protein